MRIVKLRRKGKPKCKWLEKRLGRWPCTTCENCEMPRPKPGKKRLRCMWAIAKRYCQVIPEEPEYDD